MSTSYFVRFLRDKNDPVYQKNLAAFKACFAADIDPPEKLWEYFNNEADFEGPLEIEFEPREWSDEDYDGCEIDISDIPEGVKTIRFYYG